MEQLGGAYHRWGGEKGSSPLPVVQTVVQRRIGAFFENLYNFGRIDLLDIAGYHKCRWMSHEGVFVS